MEISNNFEAILVILIVCGISAGLILSVLWLYRITGGEPVKEGRLGKIFKDSFTDFFKDSIEIFRESAVIRISIEFLLLPFALVIWFMEWLFKIFTKLLKVNKKNDDK